MGKRINLAALAAEELYEPEDTGGSAEITQLNAPHEAVPIEHLALNPLNKRRAGGDDELESMAETLRERGVIQPLVVCSSAAYVAEFPAQSDAIGDVRWVVLIGNRRLQAARIAQLPEVPIVVNDDQVTSMYEVMLVENGQRRDLPPTLEAEAMAEVLKANSVSQRELARRLGKSHVYVAQRLILLNLVPELRTAVDQGELKIELAREFGELSRMNQQAIVAAGKPYRRPSAGNGVTRPTAARSIRITSPAAAAESIRQKFSSDELAELVRLLTSG